MAASWGLLRLNKVAKSFCRKTGSLKIVSVVDMRLKVFHEKTARALRVGKMGQAADQCEMKRAQFTIENGAKIDGLECGGW